MNKKIKYFIQNISPANMSCELGNLNLLNSEVWKSMNCLNGEDCERK